ncbi:hypothetical protein J31TS4_24360 [Paenibacillus sp. J31TS4]|uniref:XTP/dITP diphosphatase n=1 Tax=Paenibacillus sp. J31TS4 TaxID=2807195 RepID=UPI001B183AAA|nr:XTP/dITP diphosphatase [Paenibacillus sp. J31TS4]GIP39156.1 hypothetical protein J31TS4_24360 [Paenibacillus sp. J31TS4]
MQRTDDRVVVIATRNQGKVREFAEWFGRIGWTVRSLSDYEALPEIVEDGDTFEANAFKKAKTIADLLGVPVLADDSGLCVDALDGAPGVYSARYAGEGASDADNNAKLLRELKRIGADDCAGEGHPATYSPGRFVCVLVLYDPRDGRKLEAKGEAEGWILQEAKGAGGFGYDPLFYLPEYHRSMGELELAEKNRISHRASALRKLMTLLETEGLVG